MKIYVSILIYLTIILSYNVSAQNNSKELIKLQKTSLLFFNDNDFDNALINYKKLIDLDSLNSENYFQYGVCLFKIGKQINSIPYFQKADQLLNTNIKLYYYLGVANHLKHNFDLAVSYFEKLKMKFIEKKIYDEKIDKEINTYIKQCFVGKTLILKPLDIKIENLGNKLNSEYPEYIPLITKNENTIYFTTRRPLNESSKKDLTDNHYFEDVYVSHKIDNIWQTPSPIKGKINSVNHDACVSLNYNETKLYIYKEHSSDIFYSELKSNNDGWTEPEPLNENINTKSWEPSAYESQYDSTMYFSSNKPGGYGGLDIYKSKLFKGEWGPAENLGPIINTSEDEDAPFIHAENHALYFSSKGHFNMGGYDFFISHYNKNLKSWSKPENIGYPLNSAGDDIYFSWNKDLSTVYFSSVREDSYGEKDIYKGTSLVLNKAIVTYEDKINQETKSSISGKIYKNKADSTEKPYIYLFHPNNILMTDNKDTTNRFKYKSLPFDNHKIVFESPILNLKSSTPTLFDTNNTQHHPLPEIYVYLLNPDNEIVKQTKSDKNGNFRFDDLQNSSNYKLAFSTINKEPKGKILLKSNSSVSQIVLLNDIPNSSHIIYGKIETNTKDLSHKEVFIKNDTIVKSTFTDKYGYYAFTHLDNKSYLIELSDGTKQTNSNNVLTDSCLFVNKKHIPKFKFNKLPSDTNIIDLNFEIHGKLIAQNINEKLNDVSLLLINTRGEIIDKSTSNHEGLFKFEKLKHDNYYVLLEKYNPNIKALIISLDDLSKLEKDNFYSNKRINKSNLINVYADSLNNLSLSNSSKTSTEYIIGKINYLKSSKPASNLITYLLNHNNELIAQTKTNHIGEFYFKDLPVLDYKISFPTLNQKIKAELIYTLSDNALNIEPTSEYKNNYIVYGKIANDTLMHNKIKKIYLINNDNIFSTSPNKLGYYAFIKILNPQNNLITNPRNTPKLNINSTIDYLDNCLFISKSDVSKFKYHKLLNSEQMNHSYFIFDGLVISKIKNEAINDLSVLLIDDVGNIVDQTKSDKNGYFKFHKLDLNNYYVVLEIKNNNLKIGLNSLVDNNHLLINENKSSLLDDMVFFDYNSFKLTDSSIIALDKILKLIVLKQPIKIKLYCYSDPFGNQLYNMDLSKLRGLTIKKYLKTKGITNVSIMPMGAKNIKIKSQNKEINKINRRVEFEIIQK